MSRFTPADIARLQQRKLMSPEAADGGRTRGSLRPGHRPTVCPCGAPTDALGSCLGTCAGEEWE